MEKISAEDLNNMTTDELEKLRVIDFECKKSAVAGTTTENKIN